MKIFPAVFFSLIMILSSKVFAESTITVTVDGDEIFFKDAPPVIVNDRTYVPMRAIFESLGAYVEWDNDTRCVFAHKRLSHIVMHIDEGIYYVNSDRHTMVAKPLLIDDRLMLPVRDVSESIGAEVLWSAAEKKVIISSKEEKYKVEDMYLEFWKKYGDDIVLTGVAAYPQINVEGQITEAFNEFILGESEAYADRVSLEYYDAAVKALETIDNKDGFMPYMFERSFDITYDENSMICVLFNEEIYADGVLPYVFQEAMTYDMNTGQLLEAWDVLNVSESEIRKRAREEFLALVEEKPDDFYFDAKTIINNGIDKLNWYINEDGVHFFINSGIIAPLSYGAVEIKIK